LLVYLIRIFLKYEQIYCLFRYINVCADFFINKIPKVSKVIKLSKISINQIKNKKKFSVKKSPSSIMKHGTKDIYQQVYRENLRTRTISN